MGKQRVGKGWLAGCEGEQEGAAEEEKGIGGQGSRFSHTGTLRGTEAGTGRREGALPCPAGEKGHCLAQATLPGLVTPFINGLPFPQQIHHGLR